MEAQVPDPSEMLPVPEDYADTLLGVFWNKIRTVAEDRTLGWTRYREIREPIKEYVKANRNVPVLTKFGTGKKLPCSDMVRFISCMLANIKLQDAKDESYMQKEVDKLLEEIGIKDLSIIVGAVDGFLDIATNPMGLSWVKSKYNKPFDGITIRWSSGHIDIKM